MKFQINEATMQHRKPAPTIMDVLSPNSFWISQKAPPNIGNAIAPITNVISTGV
jgi:hypothetical protein